MIPQAMIRSPRRRPRRRAPLLLGLLLLAGCGGRHEATERATAEVRATVAEARRATVPATVAVAGSLAGEVHVQISTRASGFVREVTVREGAHVAPGQLLVRIDDADVAARRSRAQAAVSEAEAVLAGAQTALARHERLHARDAVPTARLDEVRTARDRAAASVDAARAALRDAEVQLGYLTLVAPVAGTVVRRHVDPGDLASPGQPLLEIEQVATMKVTAGLSERDANLLAPGDSVTVEAAGASRRAVVARVLPAASPASRTFDLEAYLPNPDGRLRSGMFARVLVPIGERPAVLLPAGAVFERGQLTGVWLVDGEGRAHLRWIRAGRVRDGQVEVLSGLAGGEAVAFAPARPLTEGDRVVR